MARKHVFNDDSDEDSIATDSTVQSDTQDIYEVEKILAEERHIDTGIMQYLVKWAGYPLDQCTWEQQENFESEGIMEEWNKHKQLIREGKETPFNVDEFETAVENRLAEQGLRQRRRRMKRRKRGIPVSAHESEDEPPSAVQQNNKKQKPSPGKQPAIQRKGVAQKLEKRCAEKPLTASASSDSSGSEDDSSVNDSMVEELKSNVQKKSSNPEGKKPTYSGTAVVSRNSQDQLAKAKPFASASLRAEPVASTAARKSAPSTGFIGKAKRTVAAKDLSQNWAAQKERKRQRARVSGDTAGDCTNPRFTKLSVQNRFQLYGRDEPAPNINALNIIDPKTGKTLLRQASAPEPPEATRSFSSTAKVAASGTGMTHDTPTAYHRRTPPPEARPRTVIPQSPEPIPARAVDTNSTHVQSGSNGTIPTPGSHRWQQETCRYWLRGTCQYTPETCRYAHWYIQTPSEVEQPALDMSNLPRQMFMKPNDLTCHFWKKGHCKKPESQCEFAHRDTGMDALPPGPVRMFSKRVSDAGASISSIGPVAHDSGAPGPPLQAAAPANAMPNDRSGAFTMRSPPVQTDINTSNGFNESPMQNTISPVSIAQSVARSPPRAQSWSMPPSRRSSAPALTVKAKLQLLYKDGQNPSLLQIKIETSDTSTLCRQIGSDPLLNLEQMVPASDFETLLWNGNLQAVDSSAGGITPDLSRLSELQELAELCKLHGCGLIASTESRDAAMLIYPGGAEEWKFLDQGSASFSTDSILRFRLFDRLPGLEGRESVALQKSGGLWDMRSYITIVGEEMARLDRERLLPKDIKDVFLMMPTTHVLELELYTEMFQSMGCRVYHSGAPGAWSYFRKKCRGKSLVVTHPDLPVWQIPGLHEILVSSGSVLFFSIGVNRTAAFLEDRPATFGCTRLFPHGTVVFVTDDLLQYHPEKATAVIQNFLELHHQKPEGADYSRIAARPGVEDFVCKLADEKEKERGRSDNRWSDLYDSVCALFPPDAEDSWSPGNPLPTSNLISVSPDLLPSFDGLWEKDEAAATDFMVEWFAGWCALNASRYRKFIVCHEPKHGATEEVDPLGWAKKYQHLGVLSADTVTSKVFHSTKKRTHR